MNFRELNLSESIVKSLELENITVPTKIQEEAFAPLLAGENVIARSQTGSGKTLAYLLPYMEKYKDCGSGNRVLILVPTHELAAQVTRQIRTTVQGAGLALGVVPVLGNVNVKRQVEHLKEKPTFIVGTPGRMYELIKMKKISAHLVEAVVLDEADKLLSETWIEETRSVVKCCMRDVQKSFFSASISPEAEEAARELAGECRVIRVGSGLTMPDNMEHYYVVVEDGREKAEMLRKVISALEPKKAMVFINRAFDIERATARLQHHHYDARCIHGNVKSGERRQVVEDFGKGKLRILIGTDLASRGLHFDGVDLIVHYTIPEDEKDYLHRAGRCARGGELGINVSIVTPGEVSRMRRFAGKLGIEIAERRIREGRLVPVRDRRTGERRPGQKNLREGDGKKTARTGVAKTGPRSGGSARNDKFGKTKHSNGAGKFEKKNVGRTGKTTGKTTGKITRNGKKK